MSEITIDVGDAIEEQIQELLNHPSNTDNVNVFEEDGPHIVLKSGENEIGPLALQVGDDEALSGEGGYAACLHYLTEAGQRIGTIAADVTDDGHNHIGVYTNSGINEDGSDSQPVKRLNIQGGEDIASVDWYAVDTVKMGSRGQGDDDEKFDHIIESEGDADATYRVDNDGDIKGMFLYSHRHDQSRLVSFTGDETTDVRLDDGKVILESGGPEGEGEIQFGSTGASIYYEDDELHARNATGGTTQIT